MTRYEKIFKKKRVEDYNYLLAKEQPLSYGTENLQKTILNLEFSNVDNKFKTIQVTSTTQSEGKTTVLSNLAYLLGQRDKKVLVIDLDLRRPKFHHVVRAANENGLTDYLLGEQKLEDVTKTSEQFGFDYIVAGKRITAIANALTSKKLTDLLELLKDKYDYILLDTPPTYLVSDAYYISKIVDGVLYVIGQNIARKKEVREGITELNKIQTPIIGIILSQVKLRKNQRYYYYGS